MAKVSFKSDTLSASYDVRKRGSSGGYMFMSLKGPFAKESSAKRELSYLVKRGVVDESWEAVEWGKKNPGWVLRGPEYSREFVRNGEIGGES
jgi:hypothetical protein